MSRPLRLEVKRISQESYGKGNKWKNAQMSQIFYQCYFLNPGPTLSKLELNNVQIFKVNPVKSVIAIYL